MQHLIQGTQIQHGNDGAYHNVKDGTRRPMLKKESQQKWGPSHVPRVSVSLQAISLQCKLWPSTPTQHLHEPT